MHPGYGESKNKLDSLTALLSKAKADTTKINILNELCKTYINSDATTALKYNKEAISLSEQINWNHGKIESYNCAGRIYYVLFDTAQCMKFYTMGLVLAKSEHNRRMEGNILMNIGLVEAQKFNYDKALEDFDKALKIDKERSDLQAEAKVLNNMGFVYSSLSDFPKSLDCLLEALKINKKIKNGNIDANMYYISIVYQSMKDFKNALKYGLEADALLKKSGNKYIQASNYGQLGATYEYLFDFNKALENYKKGYELNIEVGNKQAASTITCNIGHLYFLQKDYKNALLYFQKALKDSREIGDKYSEATALEFMCRTYVSSGDFAHAVQSGEKAVSLSRETKDMERLVSALEALSMAYEKVNLPSKALLAYRESINLRDSTINIDKQKEITRKQLQFDFDIKQAKLKADQDKKDAIAAEEKQKEKLERNVLIAGGAFFVTLSLILLFGYRQNRKKNILLNSKNEAIEAKDKEKELLLKELHHRVKNNLQIVSSLLRMQSRQLKDENAIFAIQDSRNRVEAMALIHQRLYQRDNFTDIPIREYVKNLVSNVAESYGANSGQMHLEIDVEDLNIDVETAIPLGLILNELVSNAFKHAFEDMTSAKLELVFKHQKSGLYLKVQDNGKGMPGDFDINENKSFGMDLINSLVNQLRGQITITNDSGCKFEILIP